TPIVAAQGHDPLFAPFTTAMAHDGTEEREVFLLGKQSARCAGVRPYARGASPEAGPEARKKSPITAATSPAWVRRKRWPPPRTTCSRALGISRVMSRALTRGTMGSRSPATTSVGWEILRSQGRLVQPA